MAEHARVWARGMTIGDPAHAATVKLLRQQLHEQAPRPMNGQRLARDLADYDRAFGLTDLTDGLADGQVA